MSTRIGREKRTIEAMIRLSCRRLHNTAGVPCPECEELLGYAIERLDKCPYREDKPVCSRCPIHCYKPAMRDRVRSVMRLAGPRMLLRHPVLAVRHLMDAWKEG